MTFLCRTIWILPIILACVGLSSAGLKTTHEWKYVDYVWDNDKQKQDAIRVGLYNYATILIFDHQPLPDGRELITTPKFHNNPATLSLISNKTGDGGPLLAPYPDWSWHKSSGDCSGITSVNRAVIDKCNRLWIVDSGTIGDERVCPAKILAFDLRNDKLVKEFQLADDLMRSPYNNYKGLLEVQLVESYANACDEYWVYIADWRSYGVVIYDGKDAWRLDEKFLFPTKEASQFSIAGENFTLGIGPSAYLITPDGFLKEPYMILKSASNFKSWAVTLRDLHNSKCGNKINYYVSNYTGTSQEVGKGYSQNGVLVTGFAKPMQLVCWNLQHPLESEYVGVLEQNDITLQFIASIKFITEIGCSIEKISVMTNRFQKYILKTMDFTEVNFRVMTSDFDALVKGTVCEPIDHPVVVNSIVEKEYLPLKGVHPSRWSPYNNNKGLLEIGTVESYADACDEYWVYVGDIQSYGVVIYDGNSAWRLDEKFFFPSEEDSQFSIAGANFTFGVGPSVFLITPDGFLKEPYMIFKSASNLKTWAVSLRDLHNSKCGNQIRYYITNYTALSQEPAKGYSKDGILVTSFAQPMQVVCWNLQYPLKSEYVRVLEQNDTTLQYVASVKFITENGGSVEKLTVMSNRFQKYILKTMDFTEVNFRVMMTDIEAYVKGNICQPIGHPAVANSIVEKEFSPLKVT